MADKTLKEMINLGNANYIPGLLATGKAALGSVLEALGTLAAGTLTEETVTVTTNVGTLSSKAGIIFGVWASAGATTGIINVVPPSVTVITKTAKLATDRQTLTFFAADAVTQAKVLYLPVPSAITTLVTALAAVAGP